MRLPFELDPQIIHHIIYSQAGSIGKAIIELLMNSVDADAKKVRLAMSREGFVCEDDGKGFASEDDVKRYFGRFGTPHQEGDATYGRFRLGRGQIMAHARTQWQSNAWQMNVDTRTMGYSYDLQALTPAIVGCRIEGTWYDVLTDAEFMSAVQEIRDLVRYTPVAVEMNGKIITRDPRQEEWDAEDDVAYYRVKEEGAVSIYNQGVLVRHDAAQLWGAGGLIVSKKAINLNVSRTEILRKTCPVWQVIAKQFGKLASEMSAKLGSHRKTEARRQKSAQDLMACTPDIARIFDKEEVITILPGRRHVTMFDFLERCRRHYKAKKQFAVAANAFDVPKGETIARNGLCCIVHAQTLERFNAYSTSDFIERLTEIHHNILSTGDSYAARYSYVPELLDFQTLRDALVERTWTVSEKTLDRETRRAWTALRWCLQQYAALCTGGRRYTRGQWIQGGKQFEILLGESNVAEAWTDSKSYIALNKNVIDKLKKSPLQTVSYAFSLIEHEVAHEGDSLECGHDEAFYQRFHDISIEHALDRQKYMHLWLMKYTTSMENEGKKAAGNAWRERFLIERAGSGREKRGMAAALTDSVPGDVLAFVVPEENADLISRINDTLIDAGVSPPEPDWNTVFKTAREIQIAEDANLARVGEQQRQALSELDAELDAHYLAEKNRISAELGEDVPDAFISDLEGLTGDALRKAYEDPQAWWNDVPSPEEIAQAAAYEEAQLAALVAEEAQEPVKPIPESFRDMVQPGETMWSLERNAAVAGFVYVRDYLAWRNGQQN
ncbi:ATP-binding protein [Herbaspirillum seropedicae]|uniref:ATP-binding protein n=1 Tax=Herbaspirillum seropedicae TaxID=964 RepID=UPI002857ADEF|nr:ATP-binding protein [Herbaspirillum seropedicae]MDR6397975.1 hypothetical protein [Herbaspirillum seropedicae]